MKKTGYFIGILAVLALIMLIAGCGGGGGGGGGEAPPPATPSCAEQGGNVCSANEECDGEWIETKEPRCCRGNCIITGGDVNKTCEEQEGTICSVEEINCFGAWIAATEPNCCKDGACCERVMTGGIILTSGDSSIDVDVERREYGIVVWYGEEAGEVGRVSFVDASLVGDNIYSVVIEGVMYQFKVSFPDACRIEVSVGEPPTTSCTDSDGGEDYYTEGIVSGYNSSGEYWTVSDLCEGDNLRERVCDGVYGKDIFYECPNGCKDGACVLEEASELCKPLLINGPTSSNVDLVIIPDAYLTDKEISDFILTAKEYLGLVGSDGLFNIEPFKSNKNKFNIYYINKTISLGGCYHESSNCDYDKINELKGLCPATNETIVIFNNDYYDNKSTHKAYAHTCNHFATAIGHSNIVGFNFLPNQLAHEFGHSFGCLKDLYYTQTYQNVDPNWPNIDVFGCPKWCEGTPTVPEPTNQGCEDIQTKGECFGSQSFPGCEWSSTLNRCLPLEINPCSINMSIEDCNEPCIWTQRILNESLSYRCFLPDWDGDIGVDCKEGYGCYQGAEGLAGYSAEPNRDTIMGGMKELRYDIASYEHLVNLLNNPS